MEEPRSEFKVSVIIPVHNAERYLAEAVESVLAQSYVPLEVLVVDDGSSDGTPSVAANFGSQIRYIHQPNRGPAAARNRGIGIAQGDVICFLDADDRWAEAALEIQLSHFRNNPNTGVVVGQSQMFRHIDSNGDSNGAGPALELFPQSFLSCTMSSMAVRKSVFDRTGMLDESLAQSEDVDWLLRVRELGVSMIVHREVVHFYRRHATNLTNKQDVRVRFFLKALKQSLDRRRSGERD